jgi:hypothetical protein
MLRMTPLSGKFMRPLGYGILIVSIGATGLAFQNCSNKSFSSTTLESTIGDSEVTPGLQTETQTEIDGAGSLKLSCQRSSVTQENIFTNENQYVLSHASFASCKAYDFLITKNKNSSPALRESGFLGVQNTPLAIDMSFSKDSDPIDLHCELSDGTKIPCDIHSPITFTPTVGRFDLILTYFDKKVNSAVKKKVPLLFLERNFFTASDISLRDDTKYFRLAKIQKDREKVFGTVFGGSAAPANTTAHYWLDENSNAYARHTPGNIESDFLVSLKEQSKMHFQDNSAGGKFVGMLDTDARLFAILYGDYDVKLSIGPKAICILSYNTHEVNDLQVSNATISKDGTLVLFTYFPGTLNITAEPGATIAVPPNLVRVIYNLTLVPSISNATDFTQPCPGTDTGQCPNGIEIY